MRASKSRTLWNDRDIRFLEENYDLYTVKELADILGRTENGIMAKAKELGIKLLPRTKNWSDEQVDYVLARCGSYCLHRLSRGSGKSLEQVRAFLRYRGYTPIKCDCLRPGKFNSQIDKIRKLAEFHTLKEMADILDTTSPALHKFLKRHNIVPQKKVRYFTKEEDEFILRHARDMTLAQISRYLKRNPGSVSRRISVLKVRRKDINPNPRCVKSLIEKTGASKATIKKAVIALGIDYKSRTVFPGWSYFTQEEFDAIVEEVKRRQESSKYIPWKPEEVDHLIRLYKQGVTYKDISTELNMSKRRIETKLKTLFREGKLKQRQPRKK